MKFSKAGEYIKDWLETNASSDDTPMGKFDDALRKHPS